MGQGMYSCEFVLVLVIVLKFYQFHFQFRVVLLHHGLFGTIVLIGVPPKTSSIPLFRIEPALIEA